MTHKKLSAIFSLTEMMVIYIITACFIHWFILSALHKSSLNKLSTLISGCIRSLLFINQTGNSRQLQSILGC